MIQGRGHGNILIPLGRRGKVKVVFVQDGHPDAVFEFIRELSEAEILERTGGNDIERFFKSGGETSATCLPRSESERVEVDLVAEIDNPNLWNFDDIAHYYMHNGSKWVHWHRDVFRGNRIVATNSFISVINGRFMVHIGRDGIKFKTGLESVIERGDPSIRRFRPRRMAESESETKIMDQDDIEAEERKRRKHWSRTEMVGESLEGSTTPMQRVRNEAERAALRLHDLCRRSAEELGMAMWISGDERRDRRICILPKDADPGTEPWTFRSMESLADHLAMMHRAAERNA